MHCERIFPSVVRVRSFSFRNKFLLIDSIQGSDKQEAVRRSCRAIHTTLIQSVSHHMAFAEFIFFIVARSLRRPQSCPDRNALTTYEQLGSRCDSVVKRSNEQRREGTRRNLDSILQSSSLTR
jgi:hypothetical protein